MSTTWKDFWSSRPFHKKMSLVVATALCVFHIYTALFGVFDALMQRAVHLILGLVLVFLLYGRQNENMRPTLWDWFLVAVSIAGVGYLLSAYDWVTVERFTFVSPLYWYETVLGAATVVIVLIATKRVVSPGLLYCVLAFLVYPYVGVYLPGVLHTAPIHTVDLLDFFYLSSGGIFGIPLGVSATEIALFIIFGAILMRTGGSVLINNIAVAMAGRMTGGPAKVAIVGSSLFGTISGSGSANVATVGSITIPMMKKGGYTPTFAAAVEAAASTGGQIMPPVMGAAAFVMSGFSGIPYSTIIVYAIFPAILYYFSLFATVHLEAKRHNLPGIASDITIWETMKQYGHMIVPIAALVYLLVAGYTPRLAGGYGIVTALVASQLRSATRMNIKTLLEAFESGAKGILIVLVSTAAAGLIVGSVEITGFGQRLSSAFIGIAGGSLFLGLVLGMVIAFILGLGMPTTPAYIVQASTVIPALIALGLPPYAAHLFAFYYACLAIITPPDATAAFTAAAIADAPGMKTGWLATRMALVAFIVPFMFAYNQALLLVGPWPEVVITVITACVGVWCLAVACEGFFLKPLNPAERVVAGIAALLLIAPSLILAIPGGVAFLVVLFLQMRGRTKVNGVVA